MSIRAAIDQRVHSAGGWERSESELQIELITRLQILVSESPEITRIFAIPNGDFRAMATAKKLKAEGVKSGIPDLCLPIPRGGFHGLYMELKKRGGSVKKEQWDEMKALHADGYYVVLCDSLGRAFTIIRNYLNL